MAAAVAKYKKTITFSAFSMTATFRNLWPNKKYCTGDVLKNLFLGWGQKVLIARQIQKRTQFLYLF
jgi:hypothetical protein